MSKTSSTTTGSTTRNPIPTRAAGLTCLLAAASLLAGCDAADRALLPELLPSYSFQPYSGGDPSELTIRELGDSIHIATPKEPVPGSPGTPGFWGHPNNPGQPCPWGPSHTRFEFCVWNPGTPGAPGDPSFLHLTNLTPEILSLTESGFVIALQYGLGEVLVETDIESHTVQVLVEDTTATPPPPGGPSYPYTEVLPKRWTLGVDATETLTPRWHTGPGQWSSPQQSNWTWTSSNPCVAVWRGRLTAHCAGDAVIVAERQGTRDSMIVHVREIAQGAPGTFTPPAGIDRTGSVDVTQDLAQWLYTVPDGSTIVLPAGATYRMDEGIIQFRRRGLTIEGNGATLVQHGEGHRERKMLRFQDVDNLTIRGLRIVGTNETVTYSEKFGANQHGLRVSNARNVLIEGVEVHNAWGDCFSVTAGDGRSRNVVIRNSRLDGCGRQGIAISGVDSMYFEHNYLNRVRRSAIDIEPGINREEFDTHHVYLRHNHFGPDIRYRTLAMLGAADISHIYYQFNHHEAHLDFETRGGSGWERVGVRRRHLYITDNTASGRKSSTPINVYRWTDVTITRNTQRINAKRESPAIGVKTETDCGVSAAEARLQVIGNDFILDGPVSTQPNGGLLEWQHVETC